MDPKKTFYVTTTIAYVNADPHIGFALELIQADVLARYRRSLGDEVVFNTGTDEHGLKNYRKAIENKQTPQEYVDALAPRFEALKDALNLSVTNFTRTSSPPHKSAAQEFWKRCDHAGDIYKKAYTVKYCVGCELEKTLSELDDKGRCPLHPTTELETIEEENYFFRFSKYQKPLLDLYAANPGFVVPAFRLKEIAAFVEQGLEDFSISRVKEKLPWGVPVPGDSTQVMYVWFDALVNYISTIGWPKDEKAFQSWWPVIQVAGKDNLRQQSAMWQAMLLSAGLPPSKQIFIHGFITAGGQKISKSTGNVIDPLEVVKKYGAETLRYYLLRHIPSYDDGDFTWEKFEAAYNGELANDLGNLVYRVASMIRRYQNGTVGQVPEAEHDESRYHEALAAFHFDRAMEAVWDMVQSLNQYIDEEKPWELAKDDKDHLGEVLSYLVSSLQQVASLIEPFMPATAGHIKDIFKEGLVPADIKPLFPKIYNYTPDPQKQ